ncbi:MAG: ketopantoate reductase family protein [Herbiconiux sp.]|uniref:ketopantoate reductase family protein n=1 Tax=Herbiconiux sp. TaxID=1871186 RepID=UPI001222EBA2|nr:ketopantoate reductase C-terminal domain-containing protein [Herbiconiux sp.]TAJ48997.1 MAG: ketopantoate reductase family protein [Herbiconiux sp.]
MRIAVIGAGAVGGVIAAVADRAGYEVMVTARGDQLEAIREHGLHLTGGWGEHTARPRASATLGGDDRAAGSGRHGRGLVRDDGPDAGGGDGGRPQLAVLTVKAQDARAALAENANALHGVPLVVVQNGLGGADAAASQLPGTPVIGGLALFAASYLSPGEVAITTAEPTYLGRLPGTSLEAFDLAADTLGGFLEIERAPNFLGAQWTKLLVNQVNALPAITGLSVQQTVADDALRAVLTASMREAVGVARARGIRFEPLLGLDDEVLTRLAAATPAAAEDLPRAMAARMGPTPNPASTLQSIRRGQLTEIDHLNGAVVAEAAKAGLEAPVNAALVALVHDVERTAHFLTPAEVTRATPLPH